MNLLKGIAFGICLTILLSGCNPPVKEGLYMEIDSRSCIEKDYSSISVNTSNFSYPALYPTLNIEYENSDFRLLVITAELKPGIIYLNQTYAQGPIVDIFLEIKNPIIGIPDHYYCNTSLGNENNMLEVIQCSPNTIELRFAATMKSYNGKKYQIENGYIRAFL